MVSGELLWLCDWLTRQDEHVHTSLGKDVVHDDAVGGCEQHPFRPRCRLGRKLLERVAALAPLWPCRLYIGRQVYAIPIACPSVAHWLPTGLGRRLAQLGHALLLYSCCRAVRLRCPGGWRRIQVATARTAEAHTRYPSHLARRDQRRDQRRHVALRSILHVDKDARTHGRESHS